MSFIGNYLGGMAYQYQTRGALEKAEKFYRRAIAKGDQIAMHYLTFGIMLMQRGDLEEGVEILSRGLQLPVDDRTKASIRCNRALAYLLLGQKNKAMAALEDLKEIYPCAQVYETLGYAYIKTGRYEEAVAYGLEGLDYDEKNTVIMDNLAQVYILLERFEEARDILAKALAIKEKQADLLYHQTLVDLHFGDREAALAHVKLAQECGINALNDVKREDLVALEAQIRQGGQA